MKRRLYNDHESGYEDATVQWSMWSMDDEEPEPLPVLEKDALWFEYEEARAKVRELERRISQSTKRLPWTEDELRLGKEATALMGGEWDVDRIREIEAELLKRASEQ